MNTTYIIIGIIAVVAILFFVLKGRKRSHLPPVPKPVEPLPDPIPPEPVKPEPPKTEPPKPEPPVELALPVPPPMPAHGDPPPPFPLHQQWLIGATDDIGLDIMRAQESGMNIREILVAQSGELRTPVILKPDTRLRIMPGVIIEPITEWIPFRLKERTSIIGGEGSVILESRVPNMWTGIAGYYGSAGPEGLSGENGRPDFDIMIYGIEGRGIKDKPFNSAPQFISLGNCKRYSVEYVHINGTHSIGLQAGGGGMFGHAAEDGHISNIRFTRVASQNLAVVNARRLVIENIFIEAPGQPGGPGSHPIDGELNASDDVLFDIKIRNVWMDFRGASQYGNGLLVQCTTGSPEIGQIEIENIRILGGNPYPPDITNWCSNGIYVFGDTMRDVHIRNCEVWRTSQCGLNLEGKDIHAENVKLINCGGGGVVGARLNSMTGSLKNVSFQYTGDGPADARFVMANSPDVKLENVTGFEIVRE